MDTLHESAACHLDEDRFRFSRLACAHRGDATPTLSVDRAASENHVRRTGALPGPGATVRRAMVPAYDGHPRGRSSVGRALRSQ